MIFKRVIFTLLFFTIAVAGSAQSQDRADMFEWHELGKAQKLAAEHDKKILVYANARWCTYCKKMEKEVFSQKSVQDLTNQYFYTVWVDIESDRKLTFRGKEMTEMEFSRGMRVTGTPTFIFIDSEGEIIAGQPGFIPEDMYSQILKFVGTDAYLDQSFEEFIKK